MANVDYCEAHRGEAEATNVGTTHELARAAAEMNACMVFISTDSVFDGHRGMYREADEPRPLNVYASTKLAGEEAVRAVGGEHMIVRTNFFGLNIPRRGATPIRKRSLAEWVLEELELGRAVPGWTDVRFTPLLSFDLAELLVQLLDCRPGRTVHLAGRTSCSKYEFAANLAEAFGYNPGLVYPTAMVDAEFGPRRPRDTSLDCSMVTQWLGRPLPSLADGVNRLHALDHEGVKNRLRMLLATG
jgi:dTDP-4-dehydrorhamnose reductase